MPSHWRNQDRIIVNWAISMYIKFFLYCTRKTTFWTQFYQDTTEHFFYEHSISEELRKMLLKVVLKCVHLVIGFKVCRYIPSFITLHSLVYRFGRCFAISFNAVVINIRQLIRVKTFCSIDLVRRESQEPKFVFDRCKRVNWKSLPRFWFISWGDITQRFLPVERLCVTWIRH